MTKIESRNKDFYKNRNEFLNLLNMHSLQRKDYMKFYLSSTVDPETDKIMDFLYDVFIQPEYIVTFLNLKVKK